MSIEPPQAPLEPTSKRNRADDAASSRNMPWVEKYRPKKLDDVESQAEAVAALRACLQAGSNMPHLLFHGPAGTGKTSSILAVAHELFGPDYVKVRVRELNASDDRGIAVVREKVKKFAQGAATAVRNKVQSDGNTYPVPGFKLVILDEADALLPDAQAALRRMMEDFSDVTRFCILCNYVSRIIDPIASRCAKFRFKPLTNEALYRRIRTVAEREQIVLSDKTLESLNIAAGGDMRLAITMVQSATRARGPDLRDEDFVAVAGLVPAGVFEKYVAALTGGKFNEMQRATRDLVKQGFSATQIVSQLQRWMVSPACKLSDASRAIVCIKLAQTERRLFDRGDDLLQLLDLGTVIVGTAAASPIVL